MKTEAKAMVKTAQHSSCVWTGRHCAVPTLQSKARACHEDPPERRNESTQARINKHGNCHENLLRSWVMAKRSGKSQVQQWGECRKKTLRHWNLQGRTTSSSIPQLNGSHDLEFCWRVHLGHQYGSENQTHGWMCCHGFPFTFYFSLRVCFPSIKLF